MKLKDKKIQIFSVIVPKDPDGFAIETLKPVAPPLWAYFRQLSGKEFYAAASVQVTEEVIFTVNYRDDITTKHIIQYKEKLYDITRIDTFEGYKNDINLYCKLSAKTF